MKIGILGLGLMGQAVAERLIEMQHRLWVYNRSPEALATTTALGAIACETPTQVVQQADVVLTWLSDGPSTLACIESVPAGVWRGKSLVQMATISPQESQHIAQLLQQWGATMLECPVLGSLPEARTGRLLLMAAGPQSQFEAMQPLLLALGTRPMWLGAYGQAATVKLALNQLIAGLTSSFALSLALIERAGVAVDDFMAILRDSALYAPTFDKKLQRMCARDFAKPNFPSQHLAKDVRLFLETANAHGINTAALVGIDHLLQQTLAQGLAQTDYSALFATTLGSEHQHGPSND